MPTLLLIASVAFGLLVIQIIFKLLEQRFGLPRFVIQTRHKSDEIIFSSAHRSASYIHQRFSETKQALSRTPHLIIHLAMVTRDKLRNRFSHYIEEVKGRRPIGDRTSNSAFLKAVKNYKEESQKETVE